MAESVYLTRTRDFLRRYARNGRGGYPTAEERFAVHMVCQQHAELLEALKELHLKTVVGTDAERHAALGAALGAAWAAIRKAEGQ